MKLRVTVCLFVLSFVFFVNSSAQIAPTESNDKKEKAQKESQALALQMVDQSVSDSALLKLPYNRAFILALAGDLYWRFDEKRARLLFGTMANEIVNANAEAEKIKKDGDNRYSASYDSFSRLRYEILPLVGAHDANLALEYLVQTRPPDMAVALSKLKAQYFKPNAANRGDDKSDNELPQTTREETDLEQRLTLLAAEQNPDQAVKLIKEILAKGVSRYILDLLQKLNEKDEKKAASLAGEVIDKIAATDFTKDENSIAGAFLIIYNSQNKPKPKTSSKKQFAFTDSQILTVAERLGDFLLEIDVNSKSLPMEVPMFMSVLDKLVPAKIARLKQKLKNASPNLQADLERMQLRQKLFDKNTTPEEMLAEILRMPESERSIMNYYSMLSEGIAVIEDESRAKKLIEQIPDEKARANAAERFETAKINRSIQSGKLDDAQRLIGNLSEKKTRIQRLIALAVEFHKKNTEKDSETAANLMKDAKALTNEFPEDANEMNDLMELVKGYAVVEPAEAFRLFEPMVEQINDFVQASSILSKYDKSIRGFSKGELIMKFASRDWDNLLIYRYINQIQMLSKANLEKVSLQLNRFQRPDARSITKIYAAQVFLKENDDEN